MFEVRQKFQVRRVESRVTDQGRETVLNKSSVYDLSTPTIHRSNLTSQRIERKRSQKI